MTHPAHKISAVLNERLEQQMERVRRTTTPVYRTGRAEPEHIGSGVLLRLADERFLVTAAHVADASSTDELYLAAQHHPVLIRGTKTVTRPPRGGRRGDDRLDVAVIHLAASTSRYLKHDEFLALDELLIEDQPHQDDYFLVAGYPHSKQKFRKERREIEAFLYPFVAVSRKEESYKEAHLDSGLSLLLGFRKRDMWRRDVGRLTAPNLHGMSGCGVWWLQGYDAPRLSPPLLAGIAIEWQRGRRNHVLSTKTHVVLGGVWASQPGLRGLLP